MLSAGAHAHWVCHCVECVYRCRGFDTRLDLANHVCTHLGVSGAINSHPRLSESVFRASSGSVAFSRCIEYQRKGGKRRKNYLNLLTCFEHERSTASPGDLYSYITFVSWSFHENAIIQISRFPVRLSEWSALPSPRQTEMGRLKKKLARYAAASMQRQPVVPIGYAARAQR